MEKKNLANKKLFIFDLDGVIYLGDQLISGALEVINKLKDLNKKIYYLTNNSTKTRESYVEKLKKMNIESNTENIITSAYATALYLKKKKKRAKIFVIGEVGLVSELKKQGFEAYTDFQEDLKIDFVVVGLDRKFDYRKLTGGLYYYLNGAEFIATNTDPTLPTEKYAIPGAGSMVAALEACIGTKPSITIGKPNAYTINEILEKENIRPQDAVMVGDRISTDILAGKNSNVITILVKTGAGKKETEKIRPENIVPDIILNSIKDLFPLLVEKKYEPTIRIEKPSKFYFFLENMAKYTSFQRMDMINLLKQILTEQKLVLKNFKAEFLQIWENWMQEYGGSNVANFYVNKGGEILQNWLTIVFPFRKNDFKINFNEGGTTVDIILDISYFFNERELQFIDFLIKEFNIQELNSQTALIRTLAETILIFSQIWNEISGYAFTMMPEEDRTRKKNGGIMFNMVFTLRPSY